DDISDELYQRVDVPLKVLEDTTTTENRKFLACDHNRDGDSYRSPWSNTYFPKLDNGFYPSERVRQIELHANEVFDIYRELYFGKSSSVSSVYLWDKEEASAAAGFAGAFLIQNNVENGSNWNSIHVVDVGKLDKKSGTCQYKLTTTILISISPPSELMKSSTTITGSLVRQNTRECKVTTSTDTSSQHIINIGKFIEDIETEMRKEIDSLYIQKTKNIVEMIRKDTMKPTQGQEHTRVLNEAVLAMALNRKAKVSEK
ncbi:hypothetical protein ACHAWC_005658, partial [Mediolabrus comicus]